MIFQRIVNRLRQRSLKQLTSRAAYKLWSQDYPPTPHNRLMELEQQAMIELMPDLEHRFVLDLGCGTGRYGLIAEQDARYVLGIDDSFAMLHRAKLNQRVLGSMTHIPLVDRSVDVLICGLAVGHSSNLKGIVQEIARVLVSGGHAVLSDFHPDQYLNGARRTFSSDGEVYEVEHYAHLLADWQAVCIEVGLRIEDVREPVIVGSDLPVVIALRLYNS